MNTRSVGSGVRPTVARAFLLALAAGAVAFVLAHLQTVALWGGVYSKSPWRGSEKATAEGLIQPFFMESSSALAATLVLVAIASAVVVAWLRSRAWVATAGFALGAVLATGMVSMTLSTFRESNLAPLAVVVYPVVIGIPALLGALVVVAASAFRPRSAPLAS